MSEVNNILKMLKKDPYLNLFDDGHKRQAMDCPQADATSLNEGKIMHWSIWSQLVTRCNEYEINQIEEIELS